MEAAPKIGGYLVHASKIARAGVPIRTGYTVKEAYGDGQLEGVVICKVDDKFKQIPGTEEDIKCDTLCLAVGLTPLTELCWQAGCEMAFIRELSGHVPLVDSNLETTVPGIYAAGDVCVKQLRQVVTAVGDGALAATELEKYVAKVQSRTGLRTRDPVIRERALVGKATEKVSGENNVTQSELFTLEMRAQLETVFERMENSLVLKLYLDERPVSKELQEYIETLTAMTDKLSLELVTGHNDEFAPCVKLYKDGIYTGLAFHGVPGGHEFTSFVLGMYNAAGPGQAMDEDIRKRIKDIRNQVDIKILVSLSCTMCPDLVIAAQHIAAVGEHVTAEVYDIQHYERLRNKYKIMSVPCMVINDEHVYFGKKNIQQIFEIAEDILK